jgi:hypothetical protein
MELCKTPALLVYMSASNELIIRQILTSNLNPKEGMVQRETARRLPDRPIQLQVQIPR